MKHVTFRIKTYLEYRKRAVNQYGLHSPFLFELYNSCFKKTFTHSFPIINKLRKELSRSKKEIEITDFGAGSLVSNSSTRTLSEMFSSASISKKQGELLHRLVNYFSPKIILELGTHLGLSSSYMASNSENKIISVEGCKNTAAVAEQNHKTLNLNTIKVITGSFEIVLPEILAGLNAIDMAYIDGNHSYEGTLWNYKQLIKKTDENSVLIFDDINWSPDMKKAWDEIISKPEISLSVNCYKFGIVFFKNGVEKQDFYFRF